MTTYTARETDPTTGCVSRDLADIVAEADTLEAAMFAAQRHLLDSGVGADRMEWDDDTRSILVQDHRGEQAPWVTVTADPW